MDGPGECPGAVPRALWFTGLWLAWFIVLYVPDIPATVDFIVLANTLSMALCVTPQLRMARMLTAHATPSKG